ncbi:MAG: HPr family phosphocarrier protein [Candidatus Pacebacteria bacterium]|nr:HPr family phosphocarrier protein [Candidatus Paceibacterota bacterium]
MPDSEVINCDFTHEANGFLTTRVTIVNQRGLHARAAAKFVKLAETFNSEIIVKRCEISCVSCAGEEVSGHSIMGLMMLAASTGTELYIGVKDADSATAHAALTALVELVKNKFGEEE